MNGRPGDRSAANPPTALLFPSGFCIAFSLLASGSPAFPSLQHGLLVLSAATGATPLSVAGAIAILTIIVADEIVNCVSNIFFVVVPKFLAQPSAAPSETNHDRNRDGTSHLLKVSQLKLLVDGFSDESSSHGSSLVSGGVEVIPPTPSPSPETRTQLMISIKPCCDLAHNGF